MFGDESCEQLHALTWAEACKQWDYELLRPHKTFDAKVLSCHHAKYMKKKEYIYLDIQIYCYILHIPYIVLLKNDLFKWIANSTPHKACKTL